MFQLIKNVVEMECLLLVSCHERLIEWEMVTSVELMVDLLVIDMDFLEDRNTDYYLLKGWHRLGRLESI